MNKVHTIILIGALFLLGLFSDAFCAGRGPGGSGRYGRSHPGVGHYYHGGVSPVFIGGYYSFPSYYPYGYSYYYPYTYDQPATYIESDQLSDWYYCRDRQGYYPYVTNCPGGWMRVVPSPSPPGREDGAE